MEKWQEHLYDEQNELRKKIKKLKDFITCDSSYHVLDDEEKKLLSSQLNAMNEYNEILLQQLA